MLDEAKARWAKTLARSAYVSDEGKRVVDAKTVEVWLAEVLAEGVTIGRSSKRGEVAKPKSFGFDVTLLRDDVRGKMDAMGHSWLEVSYATGCSVNALKQHLSLDPDKVPKTMGLEVAVAFMAYAQQFDLLRYLLEE